MPPIEMSPTTRMAAPKNTKGNDTRMVATTRPNGP